jgi:L-arabinose isomerase
MVDDIDSAFAAGSLFRKEEVEIIFLYVSTYALSATVLPVVRKCKVPVIILNLSPDEAIDYESFNQMNDRTKMTGEWLKYCSACPVPEIANVFSRTGVAFFQVTGMLRNDSIAWNEISDWLMAARVMHQMGYNRLGCLGHYYSGMLDIYTDLTLQSKIFGGHIELLEADELSELRATVTEDEIDHQLLEFKATFDISPECSDAELIRAAVTSVALQKMVEKYKLGSLAYYNKGSGNVANEDTMSSVILGCSLLTGKGIPVAGEYEIKNAQAMKIMDLLGVGGSFTEYYAMDFNEDIVLMGHDGPGHIAIAEGKTKVKPLQVYHGKVGKGLSVEMSVKNGLVTLFSIAETKSGSLKFVVAEAESVPGPILEIGNTNSRYKFSMGARSFVNAWNQQGPAHHCAIGIGHSASKLQKLALLLGIEFVKVC